MLIKTSQGSLSLVGGYAWVNAVRTAGHPWDPPAAASRDWNSSAFRDDRPQQVRP